MASNIWNISNISKICTIIANIPSSFPYLKHLQAINFWFVTITKPLSNRHSCVVSTLWINVEIVFIRRSKKSDFRFLRLCNTDLMQRSFYRWRKLIKRYFNIDTKLFQRCFNVTPMLIKTISKSIRLVISMDF